MIYHQLHVMVLTRGLSLLLQLCQNGRSLNSARGTELCRLYSSVPLALFRYFGTVTNAMIKNELDHMRVDVYEQTNIAYTCIPVQVLMILLVTIAVRVVPAFVHTHTLAGGVAQESWCAYAATLADFGANRLWIVARWLAVAVT
uniref:SFRICE_019694 n=1 Tax=Spodoptera frugiperda TaxID=7108 RepID=A0A2H1WS56_SPOFR